MGMPDGDVLLGPQVLLRAPKVEDAEHLFASVTSDPNVTEYLSWTPHPDVDETRRVITELVNVGDDHTWLILSRCAIPATWSANSDIDSHNAMR